jgi:tetratricopeptide (TPR) repeat protein
LFFDRALIHAALQDLWAAVDDLNRVLDIEPLAIDALILRGSAYRQLEIADLALDDIERALAMEPNNIDALLEWSLLARDRGDKTEARLAWIRILEIAPDSSTADVVRRHMEEMDVNSDS